MPPLSFLLRWLPNRELIGDEKPVLFLRRHWFVLFTKYLFMAALALIPPVAYFFLNLSEITVNTSETVRAVIILVSSIYYLFIWVSIFTVFIDFYLDVWILTTHRIIDIEQRGLFNHVVSEQSLDTVQDVSSTVKGIIPTFLNYGNVTVQSAGAKNFFLFRQIPGPERVARLINRLAEEFRTYHKHEMKKGLHN